MMEEMRERKEGRKNVCVRVRGCNLIEGMEEVRKKECKEVESEWVRSKKEDI